MEEIAEVWQKTQSQAISLLSEPTYEMATDVRKESERKKSIQLNLRTDQDLREFMRAIHPAFLRCVDPRQSGLLDVLYKNDVITDSDNSSLSGKDVTTRKEQARKLFILLNKLPVKTFLAKVAPELGELFPHIIPKQFTVTAVDSTGSPDEEENVEGHPCLLHLIVNRIRPATIADMLYQQRILTLAEYESIIESSRWKKDIWGNLMEKLKCPPKERLSELEDGIISLLQRYHIPVPQNIQELVSNGVLCTKSCHEKQETPPRACGQAFVRKVQLWLKDGHFSSDSEPETVTTLTQLPKAVRRAPLQSDDTMPVEQNQSFSLAGAPSVVSDSYILIPDLPMISPRFDRMCSEAQERKRKAEDPLDISEQESAKYKSQEHSRAI